MFVSTAGGVCDETKDVLEPKVSNLQVIIKIKKIAAIIKKNVGRVLK